MRRVEVMMTLDRALSSESTFCLVEVLTARLGGDTHLQSLVCSRFDEGSESETHNITPQPRHAMTR